MVPKNRLIKTDTIATGGASASWSGPSATETVSVRSCPHQAQKRAVASRLEPEAPGQIPDAGDTAQRARHVARRVLRLGIDIAPRPR